VAALVLATAFALFSPSAGASVGLETWQLSAALTPSDLVADLIGSGVTASNVTFAGSNRAAGRFAGGADSIGIDRGVILSSGDIANVIGPNRSDGITAVNLTAGDADLNALTGQTTFDAAVLEFDFVPAGSSVYFNFVFASDEYNEFANTTFNDVFAFFVNGVNCAMVPGTTDPVTLNNVNKVDNASYYNNNDLTDGPSAYNTEMDGFTAVFTCAAPVTADVTNHDKLAVADSLDDSFDSNVFLEVGSFSTRNPNNAPPSVSAGPDASGAEGSAISLDGTVTDPDGADSVSHSWSVAAGPDVDPGATCALADTGAIDTSITCTDDGTYTVTMTASDGTSTVVDDALVLVGNVAPTATLSLRGASQVACLAGNNVSASFVAADAGDNDTLTNAIDWGDGTSSADPASGNPLTTTVEHTYAPGTYTVIGRSTDDDGATGSAGSTATTTVRLLHQTAGVLAPINADGSSSFRLGRVIPVKTRVTDCSGAPVGGLTLAIGLTRISSPGGAVNEVTSASSADTGATMRSLGDGRYLYNLSTKLSQLNAGEDLQPGRYELTITNAAIDTITVQLEIRA
jgi:hypothetical protein